MEEKEELLSTFQIVHFLLIRYIFNEEQKTEKTAERTKTI